MALLTSHQKIPMQSAVLLCFVSFIPLNRWPVQAASVLPLEYEVKAGYLYNFARFVEWPANGTSDSAIAIGVLGSPRVADSLRIALKDQTLNDKPFVVRFVTNLEEIEKCHILYIAKGRHDHLSDALRKARENSILTVGDSDEFLNHGGMISFVTERNRIKFAVNLPALNEANLKVSSQMLQYAKIVK